ncbi:hypothetical protein [Henriciella sp.]|uniref:hypothetical protein n=1 Tax=Henriciella sp. TaxID=1968823 RepID=UPI002603F1F1|nr:hypothetical protein [Henriciella sp.]
MISFDILPADFDTAAHVAEQKFGEWTAECRKAGRRPEWPYVPIIRMRKSNYCGPQTQQVRGRAYATREEAVECAERVIERMKADFIAKLLNPRYRALRESVGMPAEATQ